MRRSYVSLQRDLNRVLVVLKIYCLNATKKTLRSMTNTNLSPRGPEGDIVVTDKGTRYVLHLNTITHLQARRIYTVIHVKGKPCIIDSKNLGYYERELEHSGFFRIHR